MKGYRHILTILIVMLFAGICPAQTTTPGRKITPVEVDDKKPQQPILHWYDEHGEPLKEPVLFLAELDTVAKVKSGPVYPLINGLDIGVNIFDAVAKLAGQKSMNVDVWGALSLHNWFFPVIEAGVGYGETAPEGMNFRYKAKPSFYGKIGINYNFLYKSNPDYQGFLGLRAGFSSFRYDVLDVTIKDPYWGQDQKFDILNQKGTALYGEVLFGIRVKIYKNFAMGWTGRYKMKFHTSKNKNADPWLIPGYGTGSPLGATFSLIWHFSLGSKGRIDAEGVKK